MIGSSGSTVQNDKLATEKAAPTDVHMKDTGSDGGTAATGGTEALAATPAGSGGRGDGADAVALAGESDAAGKARNAGNGASPADNDPERTFNNRVVPCVHHKTRPLVPPACGSAAAVWPQNTR